MPYLVKSRTSAANLMCLKLKTDCSYCLSSPLPPPPFYQVLAQTLGIILDFSLSISHLTFNLLANIVNSTLKIYLEFAHCQHLWTLSGLAAISTLFLQTEPILHVQPSWSLYRGDGSRQASLADPQPPHFTCSKAPVLTVHYQNLHPFHSDFTS